MTGILHTTRTSTVKVIVRIHDLYSLITTHNDFDSALQYVVNLVLSAELIM